LPLAISAQTKKATEAKKSAIQWLKTAKTAQQHDKHFMVTDIFIRKLPLQNGPRISEISIFSDVKVFFWTLALGLRSFRIMSSLEGNKLIL
jgi:hypothetical protein